RGYRYQRLLRTSWIRWTATLPDHALPCGRHPEPCRRPRWPLGGGQCLASIRSALQFLRNPGLSAGLFDERDRSARVRLVVSDALADGTDPAGCFHLKRARWSD